MTERTTRADADYFDDSEDLPDPTVIEIDQHLLEQFLLLGIDRRWCIGNAAVIGMFVLALKFWWLLAAMPITHAALWFAVRKDPDQFRAYQRYAKQGDFYEPRQIPGRGRNGRPVGFARAGLC